MEYLSLAAESDLEMRSRDIFPPQPSPMTLEPREADTAIATLIRVQPDLLEIRYKPGGLFATEQLAEVQQKRRTMMGDRPYATLTIIPADMDFSLETMRVDHAGPDRSSGSIVATAVVAKASMIERLTHVYFKYFPQLQRVLITPDEAEGRAWVKAQLEEIAETGS